MTTSTLHRPLSQKGFTIQFFHRLEDARMDWRQVAPANDIFLNEEYLELLEAAPPINMRFGYLVFYKMGRPIGVAYCQISPFNAGESIQSSDRETRFPCLVNAFGKFLRSTLVGKNHHLLVCGNLLITGEHAFHFIENLGMDKVFELVEEALIAAQHDLVKAGIQVDAIFIKDISAAHKAPLQVLTDRRFREFTFHPNMVLNLRENWTTFDNYMNDISSKYKVRARKALKSLDPVTKRELTSEEIFAWQHLLFELYKQVVSNQDFNMVTLSEEYFGALRQKMGHKFQVWGYFLEEKLIGYFTTLINGDELEAHFLGYNPEHNRKYQLYHNILFDILKLGIELQVKRIVYARTAMEIKSTLGAEPHEMLCYIRANNILINKILSPVLEYVRPPADWIQRNPFKE